MFCTGGLDYKVFHNQDITLLAGKRVVEFNVTIVDDDLIELNETFCGRLCYSGNPRIIINDTKATAKVKILDCDSKFLCI